MDRRIGAVAAVVAGAIVAGVPFAAAAAVAQSSPIGPGHPAVERACDWIEKEIAVVRRKDEPCAGLLHAAAVLALASAERTERATALGGELVERAAAVVSTPARALAIVAAIESCPAAEWGKRRPVIERFTKELLQAQDLREWKTRRTLLAARASRRDRNPTYGGFGLNLKSGTQVSYDGQANLLSSALAAWALRTYERLGMELVPPNAKAGPPAVESPRAETWPALAQFVVANQQDDGALVAWPGGVEKSRGATALGALILALARPALAPVQRDVTRAAAECAVATEALEASLRVLAVAPRDDRGAPVPPSLLELAAAARLGWSCGARDVPLDAMAVLARAGGGGSADAPIELEAARPAAAAAKWYAQEAPRQMLATTLFVLAATEAGQRLDDELAHTLVERLAQAALTPELLPLLADLVASDGMAASTRLVERYAAGDEVALALLPATARARAGFDCGLATAADDEERVRALLRFRRFQFDDALRDPGRQNARGRFGKGVRGLLGDEQESEAVELLAFHRELDSAAAAGEIAALLGESDPEARAAAARFCELLGVALDDYDPAQDPTVDPAAAAGPRRALIERLKAR